MSQIDEQIVQCKKDIEALQANLVKLEVEKSTGLQPGDVATNFMDRIRLIVKDKDERLFSIDMEGNFRANQNNFADFDYKKVGRISDFIKEKK